MRCDHIGDALGGLEVGWIEHRRRRCGQHQRAVDSARHPERHDQPRLSLRQRRRVRQLALEHLAERRARHRHRGEIGQGPPLAGIEQHDAVAFAQPEREVQLVEGQEAPGQLRHAPGRLAGLGASASVSPISSELRAAAGRWGRRVPLARRLIRQQRHVRRDQRRDPGQQIRVGFVVQIGPDAAEQEVAGEPRRPGGARADYGAELGARKGRAR